MSRYTLHPFHEQLSRYPSPRPFVRSNVIPVGMSVKEAAERLGVGRPALSNFLNGKAALSPEMAVRLEKTFGAERNQLVAMQAAYDQHAQRVVKRRSRFGPSYRLS